MSHQPLPSGRLKTARAKGRVPIVVACPVCSSTRVSPFCKAADRDFDGQYWEVWKCSACRYGWTRPTPTQAELDRHYSLAYLGDVEQILQDYRSQRLNGTRCWGEYLERAALVERFRPGGAVLDVGCANGLFLLALNSERWRRVGIDVVEDSVKVLHRLAPDLQVLLGDLNQPELAAGSFDVITFWHVFEHLFEPRTVLERALTLLKPGGFLFISVPNFESLQAGLFGRYWWALDVPRHLHHFSPRSLEKLLVGAGFLPLENPLVRQNGFHPMKHSLLQWSQTRFSTRLPYYLLKPSLFALLQVERLAGRWGNLTAVAQKPGAHSELDGEEV